MRKDSAFSGLEAAIVLIAFVVVAAVFSYVMLGAGFFATQKSQEVTYSGIKQSTSNLVLDGNIYGAAALTAGNIHTLTFWLTIPEGGQAQSMGDTSYVWTKTSAAGIVTNPQAFTGTHNAVHYSAEGSGYTPTGTLLSPGGKVKVEIDLYSIGGGASTYVPTAGDKFSLEIKPKTGAATLLSKSLATGFIGGEII